MKLSPISAVLVLTVMTATVLVPLPVNAQTAKATYLFNSNYDAQESGASAITQVTEGTTSSASFITESVFGSDRTVLKNNGSSYNNAGLKLNTSGLLSSNSNFSVETIFRLTSTTNWNKILDITNRTTDVPGLYVNSSRFVTFDSNTSPYNTVTGNPYNIDTYHHVVVTNSGAVVKTYLDGTLYSSLNTSAFNISSANMLSFFLDDAATNYGEYGASNVALVRLYDGALSASQVSDRFQHPFETAPVPEPAFYQMTALLALGGLGVLRLGRANRS